MKVFLVDDDHVSNFLLGSLLNKLDNNLDISTFLSAHEVLEKINSLSEAEYPDVLFVDLSMPIMDGWELLDELAQHQPDFRNKCRVYILSSSIRKADKDRSKAYPLVVDFLQKPANPDEILNALQGDS
ncbi:response regulator [Rufibacter roseus]|uniref:Response regulator n=1 Tax=Rufibacter roseus TaxID=1567108 RepID=A0ABW2DLG4_9BACT|nr:response regulator [Rufibacter roseus]